MLQLICIEFMANAKTWPFHASEMEQIKYNAWSRSTLEAKVTNSEESLITSNAVIGNGELSPRSQA